MKFYVMGKNVWRQESEYPLAAGSVPEAVPFELQAGRTPPAETGAFRGKAIRGRVTRPLQLRPANPVPSLGGNNCCGTPDSFRPGDQRPIEERGRRAGLHFGLSGQDVEVTGPVKVILYASSDAPDTDFVAKLVDVFPDGRAINVAEGIMRARYREGLNAPKPAGAGQGIRACDRPCWHEQCFPARVIGFGSTLPAATSRSSTATRIQESLSGPAQPSAWRNRRSIIPRSTLLTWCCR